MDKEEGVDYEVSEMVEERWSLEKEEVVVMTEKAEQVFMEHKEVVEVSETVVERWSIEKEEVVMTEEEEVSQEVVVMNKMMEERWSKGKEEVVMTEVAAVVEEEEVFEANEMVTTQFSIENEEVVMTQEVKQVVEVNEMVVKRWSLEKEDVLEITKTIMDRWQQEKEEISEDQATNFSGNTTIGDSSCEAMVEYEKAVRKFLTHTTDCPKCVIKKDVPRRNTITILFVVGFIVQFAQLFISSVVNKGGLLRRAVKQSCESIVTIAYVFLYETQVLLISRTRSVLKRSYLMVMIIKQTLQTILIKITPSGANNQSLIRRTRIILEQSCELIMTRVYVFLQETQGLLSRTLTIVGYLRSSVMVVTVRGYNSVKQIVSNNMTGSNVQGRRLVLFGVISVLLCLSGTQFVVHQEYHDVVTSKAGFFVRQTYDYWFRADQINEAIFDKADDFFVIEKEDESQTDIHVKEVVDLVVVEQKEDSQIDEHVVKEVVDLMVAEKKDDSQTRIHVAKEVVDIVVVEQIEESQTDEHVVKEVVDLTVIEKKDDSHTGIHMVKEVVVVVVEQIEESQTDEQVVKEVVDLTIVEKRDDSQTGIHVVKEVVDIVVVEQIEESHTDEYEVEEVVDLTVVEKKDDSQTGIHVAKEVIDIVVVEQIEESQTDEHVVEEVVDLTFIEKKDDSHTGIHVVKEVVDIVVVEQIEESRTDEHVVDLTVVEKRDDSQTGIHVVKEFVDIVVVEQVEESQTDEYVVEEVVDLTVVEKKDDSHTGIHVVKEVVDIVVVEQIEERQTDEHVVKKLVDLTVIEKKDDSHTGIHVVKEVVDIVVVEQIKESQTDEHVVKEEVDLTVIENTDDSHTGIHVVKEVVDIVVVEQIEESRTNEHVVKEVVDLTVVVQEKDVETQITRIHSAITLVQSGLIKRVNFILGISILFSILFGVYISITKLQRTRINDVVTLVITSGSFVVARIDGVFTRVTVNIKELRRRTLHVLTQTRYWLVRSNQNVVSPDVVTPSPITGSTTKQDGKDKKDRKVAKQLDGKVVNEKADSKAVGKQLNEHVGDGNEEGDLVTKKTDEITVVKNEGLIRARITYMTTLVLYVHIRILSTVKQTYHHFFSTKNDKDLVTDQGGDNGIVSGNGRVTQIKYIISQVLKVHMWFVVKNVYHKVFKWRSQNDQVITSQEDRRVTMWSFTKQTSYQLVVGAKLRLRSWTSIHVTTRLQTELLRIRSILKLDKVLNVKVIGQATKKLLNWLRHLVIKEEILKSIVYGGLTEIIASISIVAFFADFDTTILNVIAFAIAGLIGGVFFFVTNIWELKKEASDKYREKLGRFQYFPFHAVLAMLSFIIFGAIPPSTFVFSFLKTDDKKFAIWVAASVSLLCLSLLAIFKANVTISIYRFKYLKSVLWYNLVAIGVSICSYLASKMVKGSIEDFGLFDTSACDAMSRHN